MWKTLILLVGNLVVLFKQFSCFLVVVVVVVAEDKCNRMLHRIMRNSWIYLKKTETSSIVRLFSYFIFFLFIHSIFFQFVIYFFPLSLLLLLTSSVYLRKTVLWSSTIINRLAHIYVCIAVSTLSGFFRRNKHRCLQRFLIFNFFNIRSQSRAPIFSRFTWYVLISWTRALTASGDSGIFGDCVLFIDSAIE